jgi:glucose/arabinose dehydrogenase
MRLPTCLLLLVAGISLGTLAAAPEQPAPAGGGKPYGLEKRIPWTTSKVVGSPNPPPPYRVKRTFAKLDVKCPIGVAREPGSDRLILIHQHWPWGGSSRLLRIKDDPDTDQQQVLLDSEDIIYGVTFHPKFADNGHVYVGSNGPAKGPPRKTRITRYTMSRKAPFDLDPKSAKVIIEWASDGHNGGDAAFGNDGMLYVTSGDGTSDSDTNVVGQDMTSLLAKVLRIDVDGAPADKGYVVPPDNPFVNMKGARPEIWAYGLRNPWRIHCDRATGDIWVGQNGQDLWEQAYLVKRGDNYGWSVMEGSHPFYLNRKPGPTPFVKPFVEHHHTEARSLTGGVVYHGKALPELRGAYIYGDWSTGKIWGVKHVNGKKTWHQELTTSTLQITGFGIDSRGELLIADHGGGYYQLEPTPKETPKHKFPTTLSETGLFASVKDHKVNPALIPYDVIAPLWADDTYKIRYIAIPGDGHIEFTAKNGWNFPEGTVLVKTFLLDLEEKNPAARRRLETRLLTKQWGQWAGYTYRWNDEQTEAYLVEANGRDETFTIRTVAGGKRQQTWHYPGRTECMVCHSRAANFVLGPSLAQMNRSFDYGTVTANQLRTLEHLGMFRINVADHLRERKAHGDETLTDFHRLLEAPLLARADVERVARPPAWSELGRKAPQRNDRDDAKEAKLSPAAWLEKQLRDRPRFTSYLPKTHQQYQKLVDPYDRGADLDLRARSYLHANCAHCHVTAGGGNAMIDLDFFTARDKARLVNETPQHDKYGIDGAKIIVPGHPEKSILYQRMSRRGPGQMPPLATAHADRAALELLHEWITKMK